MDVKKQIRRARGRGASLVALTTADQPAAERLVVEAINGDGDPVVAWDCVRGPRAVNPGGEGALMRLTSAAGGMDPSEIVDWATMSLLAGSALLQRSVLIVHNAQALLTDIRGEQGVANLRDVMAASQCMLVMLCPAWPGSAILGSDVLVIDDPLPDEDERRELIASLLDAAVQAGASISDMPAAVDAAVRSTRGLSRYAVDQTVSLSLEGDGLDAAALQRRFVSAINATPGLTFEPDVVPLDDIGGLANVKAFARALAASKRKPRAIVFIDEIEKAVAGSSGASQDSSGASQAILGALLTWMQEENATGLIALGPPGAGKSMSAKAFGGVCDVPTIFFDLAALKGSLVGQTEQQVKTALKTIKELAGEVFFVATCNSEASLPPELRRRFKQGVWFFDLPTAEERETIWQLYLAKYELEHDQERPDDDGWTGAEIAACCESAWSYSISLVQAAQWIVPVAKSAAEQIDSLRKNASGRYISASTPGAYQYHKVEARAPAPVGGRAFDFDN